MTKRTFLIILSFLLVAAGFLAVTRVVTAQDPQPTPSDNDVNRVAKQMFCPVCENIPLDVCPTQACSEWRELIRQKLAAGWTDQQIKEYFAQQYGDRVLAEPPRRGLNWVVYILPVVAFAAGAGIVWSVLSSMRKGRAAQAAGDRGSAPGSQPSAAGTAPDDPYLAQLEEALKNKKE